MKNKKSTLVKAIATDGSILVQAIDSTAMVAEMERIHKTSSVNTAALGRLTTVASMMGITLKNERESLTIKIDGGGPAGILIAVTDQTGNVKSYISNPLVELPLNEKGKLDVAKSVGSDGDLIVIRDFGLKEPQTGMVSLVSGEIAEDITYYFATSEQVPTACGLGVLVNPDLTPKVSGGFLAQILPGGGEEAITILEKNLEKLSNVTSQLVSGKTPEDICRMLLDGLEPQIVSTREVEYMCDCSLERVERALISIGKEELEKIVEEDNGIEVKCDFCNKLYTFDEKNIRKLINDSTK